MARRLMCCLSKDKNMKHRSKILLLLLALLLPCVVMSCGDNIEPTKEFHDTDGYAFMENGVMRPATTRFTADEMLERLTLNAWKRDYAFYYDKRKVGTRRDVPPFVEQNYFVFALDGTAYMGNVDDASSRVPYTYTITDRTIEMKSASVSYTMKVVAIDDKTMIVDTPLTGQNIYGYDEATVVQRTVFKNYLHSTL